MISKQKYKILLILIFCIIGLHLISKHRSTTNDLQSILDQSLSSTSKQSNIKHNRPAPGNRLDNPPNEIIPNAEPPEQNIIKPQSNEKTTTKDKRIKDYTIFFEDLENFAIHQPSLKKNYKTEKAKELFSYNENFPFTKEYLENILNLPDETVKDLKKSHTKYVNEQIPKLVNKIGLKTFGNYLPSDPEWDEYQQSSGYVLVGGGRFSWLSYLVIQQLRATGSKLPIELFIATESDYESEFCEKVIPKFNARCNLFNIELAKNLADRFNVGGYQYKMLAILSSKFNNLLYLDSDNFPARNPDYLFESELYKHNQLILWPDAWARTTNPKYYEIAGLQVNEKKIRYSNFDGHQEGGRKPLEEYTFKNSWFHDFEGTLPDPTSETGMLIVNKTSHLKTLLLCLYYNVFGPDFYYPLMTQGSAGEGDKETFIAAATVMKESYHQTKKQFHWCGYHSKAEGKFVSKALAHYDPIKADKGEDSDFLFMHLSYPKFYPNWLVENYDLIYPNSDEHIRMYSSINDNIGYDFDLRVLGYFTQGICPNYYGTDGKSLYGEDQLNLDSNYMGNYLWYVKAEESNNLERCNEVFIPHLKWLKETNKFNNDNNYDN
ncbi:unnamed protein product [Candida verbasci]|uniref:Alpha-1,2-mannosyltransferase n=1 Tax=Candida verbasci TaxID=1227364 RepID=A0A9W4TUP1_9ASCO|nr:unnamed protein product [Candida verbasci]